MLPGLFIGTTIPVLEQVAAFAEARHGVLAGNIANLDTPGYRVRDLSLETFQQRLKEALETRQSGPAAGTPGPLRAEPGDPLREVRDTMKNILFHDQSDVGLEQQVAEVSNNQLMYNLALSVMTSQYRLLQAAISERV